MQLFVKGTYSGYIREALGIPGCEDVKEFSDGWLRSTSFEAEVNEMQTLSPLSPWYNQGRPTMRYDNGQLILKDYGETILSPTDVMLLSTLAYGPMLSNG